MSGTIQYDKNTDALENFPMIISATYLALKNLGGEADISDIEDEVINILDLTNEQITRYDDEEEQTVLEYNLAWARTYLKRWGAIKRDYPGHWSITKEYSKIESIDQKEAKYIEKVEGNKSEDYQEKIEKEELEQRKKILNSVRHLKPVEFEHLCANLLTALGFENVENTRPAKDGGIDGTAVYDLLGLEDKQATVIFQCKKYNGEWTVRNTEMDAFIGCPRYKDGAIKIYFTSGTFTSGAEQRAQDENIITINQDTLVDLLINCNLADF